MDAGAKMALIPFQRAVGALKDLDTAGKTNYYVGTVVNITDLMDVNVSLFLDRDGTVPLPQNGIANVTDSEGVFSCFIAAGSYKVKALGQEEEFDLKSIDDAILSLTLAEATAKTDASEGMLVKISDRANGNFKYVTGEVANGFNIISHDTLNLQIKLAIGLSLIAEEWGVVFDGITDNTLSEQAVNNYGSLNGLDVIYSPGATKRSQITLNGGHSVISKNTKIIQTYSGNQPSAGQTTVSAAFFCAKLSSNINIDGFEFEQDASTFPAIDAAYLSFIAVFPELDSSVPLMQ